jgi:hypothetical protein
MPHIFIAYDTRSGQIVGVHHGPADPEYEWMPEFDPDLHVAILRASALGNTQGKHYAVDTERKRIIETAGEQGMGFGFGHTGGTSHES